VPKFVATTAQLRSKQRDRQRLTKTSVDIKPSLSSSISSVSIRGQRPPPLVGSAPWRTAAKSAATPGERDGAGKEAVVVANDEIGELSVE